MLLSAQCAVCDAGYHKNFGDVCTSCQDVTTAGFVVMILAVIILILIALSVKKWSSYFTM